MILWGGVFIIGNLDCLKGELGQPKRNFVTGSNSQNVNPNPSGGGGGKKFRPNRRRQGGNHGQSGAQMAQNDERLNKSVCELFCLSG